METTNSTTLTVETVVNAPIEKVWEYWTAPEHIMNWCQASDDWHAPYADNDLQVGGKFKTTMAAKDGSFSFDFGGVYSKVQQFKEIGYKIDDGREVAITFNSEGTSTKIVETFEPESNNSLEMQQTGWQMILENFRKYTEQH